MPAPAGRGPAASPPHALSTDPSNPYKFPPQLWHAGKLPPKVTDKYVFFFGYEGTDPHIVLQQWFAAPFTAPKGTPGTFQKSGEGKGESGEGETVEFPTTEHFMMYYKALLMNDSEIAEQIIDMSTNSHPSRAKLLGRGVRNFDLEKWKQHADDIVEEANWGKFSQNADLGRILLETGARVLVEASPDDKIWGIGFNSEDAEGREGEWGNNGLGKALMRVRARLEREKGKEGK